MPRAGRRLRRCSDSDAEMLRYRFNWAIWPRRPRKGAAARWSRPGATSDRPDRRRGASRQVASPLLGQRRDCDPVPGSAASAKRISAERECEPVFFMTAARWFSIVRWLMPRSAAMFLLGWPASTSSMIWRWRGRPARRVAAASRRTEDLVESRVYSKAHSMLARITTGHRHRSGRHRFPLSSSSTPSGCICASL